MSKNVVTLKCESRSLKAIECGTIRYTVYGFLLVFYNNFVCKMHHFWDIRLVTMQWPWNPGYGSIEVLATDTDRYNTYDLLLTSHSNRGPISYRFRDIRRVQSNNAKFSHHLYIAPPLKGFPLEMGIDAEDQKTRMMALPSRRKPLTLS